ncbi:hypothetical protein DOTSEDRAFT_67621 [Dothistroma septosporum NZE10]|uniref:DUF3074 domain-containing protein n=1 Tax=Dothistroma septosporum (strain NZE10 / CBS 128990) TaxID=675120 RepID=N1Q058_DOTSN|nr:hypothetical protein DOTSEDRAFT_67621 [Dothistroma septosporum NZE10]
MTTTKATPALGSHIRMKALKPSELPPHPSLASLQTAVPPPPLTDFVATVLEEAEGFMTEYLPATFRVKAQSKPAPPSTATVELLAHEISAHDLPEEGRTMGQSETWFARTSVHENAAKAGTASWEEFDGTLRENHSQHEKDYTPDVIDAHEVLNWQTDVEDLQRTVAGWNEVNVTLTEMLHNIPFPLNNRVFGVLVITAKKEQEFHVVQIPVDLTNIPGNKYNEDTKVTPGMYCSIERGELIEAGTKTRWQMATASDAGGNLPMFLQKLGVPGAVVKDVGLVIDWCEKRRQGKA